MLALTTSWPHVAASQLTNPTPPKHWIIQIKNYAMGATSILLLPYALPSAACAPSDNQLSRTSLLFNLQIPLPSPNI